MTTSDVELLPLPEPFAWVNPHDAEDFIDGEDHHFTALRHGVPDGDFPIYSAEQVRACVEARTEALRAEVDALRSRLEDAIRDGLNEQVRAERLAEALRIAFRHLDVESMKVSHKKDLAAIVAALHPTAAQEGKDHG